MNKNDKLDTRPKKKIKVSNFCHNFHDIWKNVFLLLEEEDRLSLSFTSKYLRDIFINVQEQERMTFQQEFIKKLVLPGLKIDNVFIEPLDSDGLLDNEGRFTIDDISFYISMEEGTVAYRRIVELDCTWKTDGNYSSKDIFKILEEKSISQKDVDTVFRAIAKEWYEEIDYDWSLEDYLH